MEMLVLMEVLLIAAGFITLILGFLSGNPMLFILTALIGAAGLVGSDNR